jgi:DNA-binding SARP family transcriptional activator/tetratricopeptide (TPR) repeat protein
MIELHTFGRLELTAPETGELRAVLVHPKRTALLVYLALGQPRGFTRRDALLALFWPELDQDRARASLRKALHHLRRELGAEAIESRGDEEIRLVDGQVWCDALEFEAAFGAGQLARAVELYRGSFLEAFFVPDAPDFERWMEGERSRLHRKALDAAGSVAEQEEQAGNRFGAAHWGRLAAGLAPDDEGALRRLMELLDRLGDRAGAAQAYEDFGRRIKADLDIEPSAETQALARRIKKDVPFSAPAEVTSAAPLPAPGPRFKATAPKRNRSLAVLTALIVVASGSWAGLHTSDDRVSPPAGVVIAVFPFEIRGDPGFAYLGEGLPSLLSTGLDGAGEMRSIDPRTLKKKITGGATQAGSIAADYGAGAFVLGDAVASGSQIRINASLYQAGRPERKIGSASAEGPADSLFGIVDQLAARLIAVQRGEPSRAVSRLAALTTHSIPALKAYLEGEREFETGTFPRAIAGFQHAIGLDSAFALAYYRLAQAYAWSGIDSSRWAAEQAARYGSRLPAPERELVEAFLWFERGNADEAERRYREILRRRPQEVDAFFNLGEVLFHYNPDRGRPVREGREHFERAFAFNDGEAPLIHLLEILALEREYRAFDSLIPLIEPGSHFWLTGRMVHAYQLGIEADRVLVEAQLRRASDREMATVAAHALFLIERADAAEHVVRLLDAPGRSAEARLYGRLFLAHLYLSSGRWRDARRALDSARLIDPLRAAEHAALLFSTPLLPIPRETLVEVRRDLDRVRLPDTLRRGSLPTGDERYHPQQLMYLRGILDARIGDFAVSLEQADRLALDRGPDSVVGTTLAGGIRAYVGVLTGKNGLVDDGLASLRWSPSAVTLSAFSPFPGLRHERFVRAEHLARSGRLEAAVGWLSTFAEHSGYGRVYLAPSLYLRGEILEQMGKPAEAAAAYHRFIQLWAKADLEFQPMVQEAWRRVSRLRESF